MTPLPAQFGQAPAELALNRSGLTPFAFAFAVVGDPVSSVAYAIEAALRALEGRSLIAALAVGATLNALWVRADRPREIAGAPATAGAAPTMEEPAALDQGRCQ
jgi:hypothetical protein